MRPGDIVVRYDKRKVRGFEDLTKLVSQQSPGDIVKVELLRNGETVIEAVVLGEWE
ncbi:MAG: PDZ domain-containing protein [Planctomycetes bacterium]|nr:PDZ domain-containing protein [Planctomycetota bacterium]